MAQEPKRSPEIDDAVEQVEAAKSFTAKPDLVRHFGEERLHERPGGGWDIHLRTWREVQEFDEMDRPRARLETEQARRAFAKVPCVLLRASNGKTWEVPEVLSKNLCESPMGIALGVREVPRTRKVRLYARDATGRAERVR